MQMKDCSGQVSTGLGPQFPTHNSAGKNTPLWLLDLSSPFKKRIKHACLLPFLR